jgi:hypothetical protein
MAKSLRLEGIFVFLNNKNGKNTMVEIKNRYVKKMKGGREGRVNLITGPAIPQIAATRTK